MKNKPLKIVSMLGVILLLSSCAETNTSPSCNKVGGKGIGCASMDTAYGMSKQGYFARNGGSSSVAESQNDDSQSTAPASLFINQADMNWQPTAGQPLRYGETVQVIWIAPFIDTQGDYYYPHLVSTVVKNGYWIGAPQSEINLSGDN